MSEQFDPYHRWLAIPPKEQPPTHYRLLGLAKFEGDRDVIDTAADRQMAHVRTYQSGKYGEASQKLLNEIAGARVVLLDAQKKAAYDASLRDEPKPLKQATRLPDAQPLAAAAAPARSPAASQPQPEAHETKPAAKFDASQLAPLLLAGGAVVLVLLLAVGVGAWFVFGGGDQRQVVEVDVQPTIPPPQPPPIEPFIPPVPREEQPPNTVPPVLPPGSETDVAEPPSDEPPVGPGSDEPSEIDPPPTPTDDPPEPDPPAAPTSPIAALLAPAAADERLAPPAPATQATKREQIESLFGVSSARSAAQRVDMAQKLLDTARDTDNDADARYVLLDLARDIAGDGGDWQLASEAIDALDEEFRVDGLALRAAAIAQTSVAATQMEARQELVDEGLQVVDELFAADKFVEAAKLIKALQAVAAKTRDKEQRALLATRQEQGSSMYKGYKDAQAAIETLRKTPDDADAAVVAGKYFALVKGDWPRGLVMLSVGSDAALKSLAESEMRVPDTTEERLAVADAWNKQAGSRKGLEADRQRARAAMWYGDVVGELTGLAKVEAQRKLAAIGKLTIDGGEPLEPMASTVDVAASTPRPTGQRGKPVDLLALVDPQRDAVSGEFRRDGTDLVFPTLAAARLAIPYRLPRSYVLEVETTRTTDEGATADFAIGLMYRGKPCTLAIDAWLRSHSKLEVSREGADVSVARFDRGPLLVVGKKSKVVCEVDDERLSVSVDGKQVLTYEGDASWDGGSSVWQTPSEHVIMLGGYNAPFIVHSMKLIAGDVGSTAGGDQEALDLLALVDVRRNAVAGEFRREGGKLFCPAGWSRLEIPYHPPAAYVLEVEATRINEGGHGGDLAVGLVYQGKQVAALIDASAGTTSEFRAVYDSGQTSNVGQITYARPLLETGRRQKVTYTVEPQRLSVSVGGREVLNFRGPPPWAGLDPGWSVPDKQALMIGSFNEPFEIHSIKLTPAARTSAPPPFREATFTVGKEPQEVNSVAYEDGPFINTTAEGKAVLKASARFVYFKIDDKFLHDLPDAGGTVEVILTVFDGVADWINVQYDGHEEIWQSSQLKHMRGTGKWVDMTFALPKAKLANRQNGDADFRITTGNTDLALHQVVVRHAAAAGGAIDLLKLVDLPKNVVHGDWRMEGDELLSPRVPASRLQIPAKIPAEYDLDLEVTRTGVGNELAIGLIYQGKQCHVGIDRYTARSTDILGETTGDKPEVAVAVVAEALKVGERSKVKCAVRKDSIAVFVNDAQIVAYRGDATWSGMATGWGVPDKSALMLGAWWAEFRIHSFTLTPVGGADQAGAAAVYLDDLKETASRAHAPIGKRGKTGLESARSPRGEPEPTEVKVAGKKYEHSIFAAISTTGDSSVTYDIAGKYRRLKGVAGIVDQFHSFEFSGPLRFKVIGDGKTLWTSADFTKHGQTSAVDVDISGVRRLELHAHCYTGNIACGWSAWLDPQLLP